MLNRVLDGFATRSVLLLILGALLTVWLATGAYFQSGVRMVERNQRLFNEQQLRNGFVSMSDIQRLTLIVQDAALRGELDAGHRSDLQQATDILFVRAQTFRRIKEDTVVPGPQTAAAASAVAEIDGIIALADDALDRASPDLAALSAGLIDRAQAARGHLLTYLDEMRHHQDRVLEEQSRAVREQAWMIWTVLTALVLVMMIALALLRREVLARRARGQAEERVNFLAFFDPLTKLANRIQYQDRLGEMLLAGRNLALMLVDLDEFKLINDTSGHAAGDAVLCHVAEIIGAVANAEGGFAARLGGDEFAVVVPTDDPKRVRQLCEEIIREVPRPTAFEGETISVGVSVGVATNTQVARNMRNVDMMARVTDFALYESKAAGRGCYTFYDNQLEQRFHERRAMLDELPQAIASGRLEPFLQPKVSLPDRRVYGFEALARWRRGETLVPPADFILIAEESGLVTEIDIAILYAATRTLADWNRDHGTGLSVSVNLSAVNFSASRIVDEVGRALEASGLVPGLLTLEITESAELRDRGLAQGTINALRELGCRVAIDDFGTGFSSLAYLRAVRADELKIDKSLVDEIASSDEARFVFDAVMDLATSLQMDLVVEGVETEEQARTVHAMGAKRAQGYLFGRPAPAAEALAATFGATGPETRRAAAG